MKRLISMVAVVGLLVGCSSTPDEQKPVTVQDATPSTTKAPTTPPPSKDLAGTPSRPQTAAGDPLNDPANILSRRSIYFDYDQFTVKEEFKPVVSAHARYVQQNRA